MNKKALTETDIRTKFITPNIVAAGWDVMTQIREEVYFTKGRVVVRGKAVARGEARKADYLLFYKPNIPLAVVEAKDNTHTVGDGMQQALGYAEVLDVPFAFSSNGDGFIEHDRTGTGGTVERELTLEAFPSPAELWERYRAWKGLSDEEERIVLQDYYAGEWIDRLDEIKTNIDERTVIANAGAYALGRKTDELIIAALDTATQEATGTGTGLTDTDGLTKQKVLMAFEMLQGMWGYQKGSKTSSLIIQPLSEAITGEKLPD